jgi:hypothetical protein
MTTLYRKKENETTPVVEQAEQILVKDTTSSKPTVTASAAVKSVEERVETLDKENEDGNSSW